MAGIEAAHLSQGWHAGSSFGASYQGLEKEEVGYPTQEHIIVCARGKLGFKCTAALYGAAMGAGEMIQWLNALPALAKDPSSLPSIHIR